MPWEGPEGKCGVGGSCTSLASPKFTLEFLFFRLYSIAPHSKIPKDMKPTLIALLALFLSLPLVAADKDKPLPLKQFNIGLSYYIEKDFKEAAKWFRKAADQGDAMAQNNLGVMYDLGQGVPKDDREAFKWYQKAANQGYAQAQYNLGLRYSKGQGVKQDFKEAVKWYQKSADQGDAMAQSQLGFKYYFGEGVLEDYVAAYAWWNISAANGDAVSKRIKGLLVKKMTPDQIAEAQKLSRELLRKIEANKAGKPKPSDSPFSRPLIDPDTGLPVIERR
jgi:hypothetical protein